MDHRARVRAAALLGAALALLAACGSSQETGAPGPPVTATTITSPASTSTTVGSEAPSTVPTTTLPAPSTAPPSAAPPTTAPPVTAAPTTVPPTTVPAPPEPPPEPPPPVVLGRGDGGDEVTGLQARLSELHYWLGSVDGDFGMLTEQAVYAFQKANGITVDGRVGPETRAALDNPVAPSPRSGGGRVTEVDKERQLFYSVLDGRIQLILNTSTGTELPYPHPRGYTALADTPPGSHEVFWEVDGVDEGALGPLYRPKYFHEDGIAVHGYGDVPPYPASHGCVRVSLAAADHIWDHDLMPLGSSVLVYGETPAV